jgi:hypothetical protein
MALPVWVAAIARLGQQAIWADARLGVHTPKQTIIARGYAWVALGINEKPLPAKPRTQVRLAGIKPQALWFGNHASPPFALCTSGTA